MVEEITEAEAPVEAEDVEVVDDEAPESEVSEEEVEIVEEREFNFGNDKFVIAKDAITDEVAEKLDSFTKNTWSDYTRKSQEVAEQRKSLEEAQKAVDKIAGLQGEALDTFSRGIALRDEVQRLQGLNLEEMWKSNPDDARQVSDAISQRQAELQDIIGKVTEHEKQIARTQQEEIARRSEEGKQIVEREINGFSEKAPEVIRYAVERFGVSQADAENWALNPTSAIMAYESMMYRRSQQKAQEAAKPEPAPAKPVRSVKGKGGPNQSATPQDSDSVDEWLKKRNRQLRNQ